MIETRNLAKKFGAKTAVEDVSFVARDGVITGLLGPNGAGKTTTLRMLYGLIRPDRGSVAVDGRSFADHDPAEVRAALGVVPDEAGLYTRLTPREHLRYSGELQGLGGRELEAAVETLIDVFELGQL